MYSRSLGLSLLAALLLSLVVGCHKSADTSSSSSSQQTQAQAALDTVTRVHWLGMKRLATETNAGYFMSVWNLPETAKLEDQTLDKLALWLAGGAGRTQAANGQESGFRVLDNGTNGAQPTASSAEAQIKTSTNQDSVTSSGQPGISAAEELSKNQNSKIKNFLLPLLEDLVNRESYLEVRAPTNQAAEMALAIHLDNARSVLWQTNLASALESLTGKQVTPLPPPATGWQLVLSSTEHPASTNLQPATSNLQPASTNAPPAASLQHPASSIQHLSLQACGAWTLLSLGSTSNSTLVTDFRSRITGHGTPFAAPATNFWLDVTVDLARVSSAFPINWHLPDNCPKTALTIIGDGQNVRTHALLDFPRPLQLELEPWNIPTNLIHDPLIGFTALRGFRPWLNSFKPWKDLQAGATPNQAYLWDQEGIPAQQYCAIPHAEVDTLTHKLSGPLLQLANPSLASRKMGQLENATNFDGIAWRGAPFVSPELRVLADAQHKVLLGSLIPLARTNLPPPPELLHQVTSRTNLLCYEWEVTGQGLEHWLYLGQLVRLLLNKAQFPTESVSLQWFKAVAPKLRNCVTLLSVSGSSQLELVRRSSVGLDSIELHLLADWVESPEFPCGLHTFLAPTPAAVIPANSNSIPNTATANHGAK